MAYEIIQINENTWRIDEGHVRFFLLTGTKRAMLIDSGMQINNAKEIAMELTDLPIELINTHADMDHVGSNHEFETFYMHPSEASNYYNSKKRTGTFLPVENGDIIDLGERPLEIVALPGHTPGSIGILDQKNRAIFSGDPIQDGTIYMFGVQREAHAYQRSLEKLEKYKDKFDVIYPSHGTFPVYPDIIEKLHETMAKIMAGECEYKEEDMWGNKFKKYETEVATFLMD